jgi:peptidoglycan hydrolase-like protein with peptidoglycan-binding domain
VVQGRRNGIVIAGLAAVSLTLAACGFVGERADSNPTDAATRVEEAAPTGSEVVVDPADAGEWQGQPEETAAPTTVVDTPTTFAPAAQKVALARTLQQGLTGDDVLRMQERLVALTFDPGKPDGIYGPATAQAVWAFQKLVLGKKPNGVITQEDWEVMQGAITIAPRRTQTTATHFEIYLPEQTAVLFENGAPRLVTHISSGDNKEWCSEDADKCGISITPGGTFKFYRRESDWWEGSLGKLYNPIFFNYGIAVHGMTYVPNYPASHGCVRIPMHVAEYFPDLVKRGDQVFVWDGKKEPEAYGAQPPPFDTDNPDVTTTSSTTTTTVGKTTTTKPSTTTTVAKPTSTKAPATTAKPAPPTTKAPATTAKPAPPTTKAPATTAAPPPPPPPPPTTAAPEPTSPSTTAAPADGEG